MEQITGPKPRLHMFGYMDETGLLQSATDPVFGLGLVATGSPRALHKAIVDYKAQHAYRGEFKFSRITDMNIRLYKGLVDIFFEAPKSEFRAVVYEKAGLNIASHLKTYNAFAGDLVASAANYGSQKLSRYIAIIADDVSTPKTDNFEAETREAVKRKTRRNALYGICRVESHAVSEIQLCDVLIGAVAYAIKIDMAALPAISGSKMALAKHIQKKLNIPRLSENFSRKMRNGIYFEVVRHKKIDGALGPTAN